MNRRTAIVLGCSGIAVVVIVVGVLIGAWFLHMAEDPDGLWIKAEVPDAVKLGDTFNDCTTTRFAVSLSPGTTAEFQFDLRAERVGRYRGQVDQFVGMQFVSTVVQTEVAR